MSHSLIPERAVQVSPSLAATIGLEEAILLQHMDACCQHNNHLTSGQQAASANNNQQRAPETESRHLSQPPSQQPSQQLSRDYLWSHSSLQVLARQLPFWTPAALRRIMQSLHELGMLVLDTFPKSEEQTFAFAINQQRTAIAQLPQRQQEPAEHAHNRTGLGGYKITPDWQPDRAVLEQLHQQGIAQAFVLSAVDEFVLYWRERNEISHGWSSKFLHHVSRRWQLDQQQQHDRAAQRAQRASTDPKDMHGGWQPSIDAIEILLRMGIHQNFIDDAIAEFVLYWQERGEAQTTWNSKFVTHVKRQYARYTHTLKHDTEPVPMHDAWQPDHEVFDVLAIANIDAEFARTLVPEFMMYWRDKNELHHSWNTKFLQYVKHQWSRTHQAKESNTNATHGQTDEKRRTRDRTLLEDLTDRSWAN